MRTTSLVVAIVLVAVVGAMAGAAVVSRDLSTFGMPSATYPSAMGSISLDWHSRSNLTTISGRIYGLGPSKLYDIYLWAPKLGFHQGLQFRTDARGNARFDESMAGNHSRHLPVLIVEHASRAIVLYTK